MARIVRNQANDAGSTPGNRPGVRRRRKWARGFTLIEAALTTVIVGTGVLSIVAAQQAYLRKNDWAQREATGILLANEIRELTLTMPIHDSIFADHLGPESGEGGLRADGILAGPNERAMIVRYNFDDVDDLAGTIDGNTGRGTGTVFSPPITATQMVQGALEYAAQPDNNPWRFWSQEVKVEGVLAQNISVASDMTLNLLTCELYRVTVTVRYQGPNDPTSQTITEMAWIVAR